MFVGLLCICRFTLGDDSLLQPIVAHDIMDNLQLVTYKTTHTNGGLLEIPHIDGLCMDLADRGCLFVSCSEFWATFSVLRLKIDSINLADHINNYWVSYPDLSCRIGAGEQRLESAERYALSHAACAYQRGHYNDARRLISDWIPKTSYPPAWVFQLGELVLRLGGETELRDLRNELVKIERESAYGDGVRLLARLMLTLIAFYADAQLGSAVMVLKETQRYLRRIDEADFLDVEVITLSRVDHSKLILPVSMHCNLLSAYASATRSLKSSPQRYAHCVCALHGQGDGNESLSCAH